MRFDQQTCLRLSFHQADGTYRGKRQVKVANAQSTSRFSRGPSPFFHGNPYTSRHLRLQLRTSVGSVFMRYPLGYPKHAAGSGKFFQPRLSHLFEHLCEIDRKVPVGPGHQTYDYENVVGASLPLREHPRRPKVTPRPSNITHQARMSHDRGCLLADVISSQARGGGLRCS